MDKPIIKILKTDFQITKQQKNNLERYYNTLGAREEFLILGVWGKELKNTRMIGRKLLINAH